MNPTPKTAIHYLAEIDTLKGTLVAALRDRDNARADAMSSAQLMIDYQNGKQLEVKELRNQLAATEEALRQVQVESANLREEYKALHKVCVDGLGQVETLRKLAIAAMNLVGYKHDAAPLMNVWQRESEKTAGLDELARAIEEYVALSQKGETP